MVDSDYNKVGRFVPGTGQPIGPPEYLYDHPADAIVITTRWRAADIAREIAEREIPCGEIFTLVEGRLAAVAGTGAPAARHA